MKKLLSLLVVFFVAAALVSCGSTGTGTGTGDKDQIEIVEIVDFDPNAQVEVTFWHAMGEANQKVIQEIIDNFNVYYPNITVTQVSLGDYTTLRDTITSGVAADEIPTIAQTYPDHVALYLSGGVMRELNSYLASEKPVYLADGTVDKIGLTEAEQDLYIDGFFAEGTIYDSVGTMYSIPFNKSTEVLIYNKTVFDRHGWSAPKTWDDVVEICEAYVQTADFQNKKAEDSKTAVFAADSEANLFITLTQQWGGEYTKFDESGKGVYAFNNAQSKAALSFFKENYDKGYFSTATHFGTNYSSDAFKAGKVIMTLGSSAGAHYNDPGDGSFVPAVTAYPQKDMNNPQVIQQGTNVSLFKKQNAQEELAGWLFMKFLTNYESALLWCTETAYFPIRKDVINSEEYAEHISGAVKDQQGQIKYEPTVTQQSQKVGLDQQGWFYTNVAFRGSSAARDNAELIVQAILYSDKSIDDAYAEAIEDLLYS